MSIRTIIIIIIIVIIIKYLKKIKGEIAFHFIHHNTYW